MVFATRRQFVTMTVSSVATTLVAACGQMAAPTTAPAKEEAPKAEAPKTAPAAPSAKAPAEVFYAHQPFFRWHTEGEVTNQLVKQFQAENPTIDFRLLTISGNRDDAFRAAAAARQPFDISSWGDWQVVELGLLNQALALNDYFKTSKINIQDIWDSLIYTMTWKDGRTFGVPYAPDLRVLYLNSTLFLEAGLDPEKGPRTWDDLDQVIAKTTKKDSQGKLRVAGFPPAWGSQGHGQFVVLLQQSGGSRLNKERTKPALNSPAAVQALTWLKKVYDAQGGFDQVHVELFNAVRSTAVGQAAKPLVGGACATHYDTYSTRSESIWEIDKSFKFGFVEHPKPKLDSPQGNWSGDHTFVLSSWAKNPDQAFAWIEFISRPENNFKFAKRFDRVPIRPSVAKSAEFTQNDPFLIHMANQMPTRIAIGEPVPGSHEMVQILGGYQFMPDVMTGKKTIQEALVEADAKATAVIEKWAKELKL